jgi:ABC-2 type transport system permease protein
MSLQAGSIGWLMRHESRLYWRQFNSKPSSHLAVIILLVMLHLIAIPVASVLRHGPTLQPRTMAIALTLGGGFVLLLMISRALITAVQALYARGDMDLLLSSPLAPRSIITVRAAFIALSVTLEFGTLIWPFANIFILYGMFGWIKAYLLLPALGMLASSVSLVLALLMFYLFGARRMRVIAQVLSALFGVTFVLLMQLPNMLARRGAGAGPIGAGVLTHGPSLDSPALAPALFVMSGALPTLAIAAACAATFALTTALLAHSFIRASVASAGMSVGKRARKPRSALSFHNNLRLILILKELRLIARDPWLLTQLLQQTVYLLPMGLVLWRQSSKGVPILWGAVIMVAGFTASALGWITVAAEDVPELISAAPVTRSAIFRIKLEAAVLPILPLIFLPLLFLWRSHLWFGFSLALCAFGSALSCALLNVRDRTPGRRLDFRARNKNNIGRGLVELIVIGAWIGACVLMVWLSPWGLKA